MNEPINFEKIEGYVIEADAGTMYTISQCERVGIHSRKFWVTPVSNPEKALQFVIHWQSNPMIPAVDTVEVEMYISAAGMQRLGKKRYGVIRDEVKTLNNFINRISQIIREFEPELSTPL